MTVGGWPVKLLHHILQKRDSLIFALEFAVNIPENSNNKNARNPFFECLRFFSKFQHGIYQSSKHLVNLLCITNADVQAIREVVYKQVLETNSKICILALLVTNCINTVGKFLNLVAQLSFLSYIVLMITVFTSLDYYEN